MSTLERAIAVAARAHEGQYDKGGAAYILHPLRVMMRVSTPEQRIVAVLHDVLEDTPLTLSDLAREGFPLKILAAVLALSRREGESYEAFVVRLGATRWRGRSSWRIWPTIVTCRVSHARARRTWPGFAATSRPAPTCRPSTDQPQACMFTGPTKSLPWPITHATCWLRCNSQVCGG